MRLILLLLLLAVLAQGGLFDLGKMKDLFAVGKLGEKIKNMTLPKLKEALKRTGLSSLASKLSGVKEKLMKKLQLSKEQKADLARRLKEIEARRDEPGDVQQESIVDINSRKNVGKLLFQSDIMLSKRQAEEIIDDIEGGNRRKRQAFKDENYPNTTWQQGVFYTFDNSADFAVKNAFVKGAKKWEEATCINFVENKDAENRIVVIKEDGCWSYVGRQGGEQPLSLGEGCDQIGVAVHELGHALGLFHTMSRYDRDDFITVNIDNVQNLTSSVLLARLCRYIKESENTTDNYGKTYDYSSIMHYGALSVSTNKLPTMVAKDTYYQESMGSHILSFADKWLVNEHYKCNEKCPSATSAQCKNGGFPHPRDCQTCICPSGYDGVLCDERPKGCGRTLEAKTTKQMLVDRTGFGGGMREDFYFCNYWIESPKDTHIEIKIRSFSHGYAEDGCVLGGVEIKTEADPTLSGYRFCSAKDNNVVLVSKTNRVPIITFNRLGQQQLILEYKIAS